MSTLFHSHVTDGASGLATVCIRLIGREAEARDTAAAARRWGDILGECPYFLDISAKETYVSLIVLINES